VEFPNDDRDDAVVITADEFKKLRIKDQNLVIFKNLNTIVKTHRTVMLHQKVQYVLMACLLAVFGWITNRGG